MKENKVPVGLQFKIQGIKNNVLSSQGTRNLSSRTKMQKEAEGTDHDKISHEFSHRKGIARLTTLQ